MNDLRGKPMPLKAGTAVATGADLNNTVLQIPVSVAFMAMYLATPGSLRAQEWTAFGIRDAGFTFEVPPGFSLDRLAVDGQAAAFIGPDGAKLVVRGDRLSGENFRKKIEAQLSRDEGEGWNVTYRRLTHGWASYSGVKDGMIRYFRAIAVCDDKAAVFQMDYSQSNKIAYDPIVIRMVKSLYAEGC